MVWEYRKRETVLWEKEGKGSGRERRIWRWRRGNVMEVKENRTRSYRSRGWGGYGSEVEGRRGEEEREEGRGEGRVN